ncbi:MAG: hemerythrin family protein [Endomicrobia bacterium]|nr:hemerythrin family protein [Endomicrobiia bacterium]
MIYEWDKNLETGNAIIDNQHRQLFSALNRLVLANDLGSCPEELNETIKFLTDYTYKHFRDEEELMKEYNYPEPDKSGHKKNHDNFKQTVCDLSQQLADKGYTNALVKTTIRIMADWLINHIKKEDFKLAMHIQSRKAEKK